MTVSFSPRISPLLQKQLAQAEQSKTANVDGFVAVSASQAEAFRAHAEAKGIALGQFHVAPAGVAILSFTNADAKQVEWMGKVASAVDVEMRAILDNVIGLPLSAVPPLDARMKETLEAGQANRLEHREAGASPLMTFFKK